LGFIFLADSVILIPEKERKLIRLKNGIKKEVGGVP
jgi:hypothetical protein